MSDLHNKFAHRAFQFLERNRMTLCFFSMFSLTASSIYFNFRLGRLNADASDLTWYVMPLAYSFLDVAALVMAMCLFNNAIKNGLLKAATWIWFIYLVGLSLFACLSCIIALDAEKAAVGDAFKRQQLEVALNQANANVATWQNNLDNTIRHKSNFQSKLDEVTEKRDDLINQISKLDSTTPPSQVVFEKIVHLMPVWMDEDQLKTYARFAFGVAMVLTGLFLAAIASDVFGDSPEPDGSRSFEGHSQKKNQTSKEDQSGISNPHTYDQYNNWSNEYSDQYQYGPDHSNESHYYDIEKEPVQQNNVVPMDHVNYRSPVQHDQEVHIDDNAGMDEEPVRWSDSVQKPKRTRKTGVDRVVAQEITDYLKDGSLKASRSERWTSKPGSISQNDVRKEFGVGKSLLKDVYEQAQSLGYIDRDGVGSSYPWYRVGDYKQVNNG